MDHLKVNTAKMQFKITGTDEDETIFTVLRALNLSNPPELFEIGHYTLSVRMNDDKLSKAKKAFFALVDEWGKWKGYRSRPEREQFKAFVRDAMGGESIADMTEPEQVYIKIEELHQFAMQEDEYLFKPFNPES